MEPEYINARRVLLDALDALDSHINNLVLVGAQAVYHHTGDSPEIAAPLYTTDADIAVNTADLADSPEISAQLEAAGFRMGENPGHWEDDRGVGVDLMVVPYQARRNKPKARAADISPHDKRTARITRGLEAVLVDNEIVSIKALEAQDERAFNLRIAGPAALLVAKAIKIDERLEQQTHQQSRVKTKDALDAFRIFQKVDTETLVEGFKKHENEKHARKVSRQAIEIYRAHVQNTDGEIAKLAARAAGDDPTVEPAFVVLVQELISAL